MVDHEINQQLLRMNRAFDEMRDRVNDAMAIPAGGIVGQSTLKVGRAELMKIEN